MQLSDEAVKRYIQIYKDEFGEELKPTEVHEIAARMLAFYDLMSRPLPRDRKSE